MENLTQSLKRVAFPLSALSIIPTIDLLSLSPAIASTKTYFGRDAAVTVTCKTVGWQSTGNFSIDARKSGVKVIAATGFVYFDNDPNSSQTVFSSDIRGRDIFSGDGYDYGLPAYNFGALIAATGFSPTNLSIVISLPDLSENPDKAFGYSNPKLVLNKVHIVLVLGNRTFGHL